MIRVSGAGAKTGSTFQGSIKHQECSSHRHRRDIQDYLQNHGGAVENSEFFLHRLGNLRYVTALSHDEF